jgi:hypothetical protein
MLDASFDGLIAQCQSRLCCICLPLPTDVHGQFNGCKMILDRYTVQVDTARNFIVPASSESSASLEGG